MRLKEFVRDYLQFTRRDRIAILSIVCCILLIFFLPDIVKRSSPREKIDNDTSWMSSLKIEEKDAPVMERSYTLVERKKIAGSLFYFDPNILNTAGWIKLGLREKTIRIIENYRSKGGRFRKPEDLQRIYGLLPAEFERIKPYIRIEEKEKALTSEKQAAIEKKITTYTINSYEPVDINLADTSAFISLPGIGSKLASRIVNFRDKLGGFYSISQVAETFGLPDSTFQKIRKWLKMGNTNVKKININTATADELKAHPYIRWNLAKPILAYRNEHGPFKQLDEMKNVMAVTEESFNKILPYLILE